MLIPGIKQETIQNKIFRYMRDHEGEMFTPSKLKQTIGFTDIQVESISISLQKLYLAKRIKRQNNRDIRYYDYYWSM